MPYVKNPALEASRAARSAALLAGDRRFKGNPCKRGHDGLRYANSGICVTCAISNAKAWQEENPESVAISRAKEAKKTKSQEHLENKRAMCAAWRAGNPEKSSTASKNWRENNVEKNRASKGNCRAVRNGAEGRFTCEDVAKLARSQGGLCAYCDAPWEHVDHIIPLNHSLRGTNWPSNLQLLCARHNQSKHCRTDAEYRFAMGWPASGKPPNRPDSSGRIAA